MEMRKYNACKCVVCPVDLCEALCCSMVYKRFGEGIVSLLEFCSYVGKFFGIWSLELEFLSLFQTPNSESLVRL